MRAKRKKTQLIGDVTMKDGHTVSFNRAASGDFLRQIHLTGGQVTFDAA